MAKISPLAMITMVDGKDRSRLGDIHFGQILGIPEVGGMIVLRRAKKNGKKAVGIWTTSEVITVRKVTESTFIVETKNSEYKLSIMPHDNPTQEGSTEWSPNSTPLH